METMEKSEKAPKKPYNATNVTNTRGFKRNNTWPAVNLKFVVDFMQARNINLGDLERHGIGHHTSLAFLFKKDNMLLSLAQKIFEAFGYKLTILLKDKSEEKKEGLALSNEAELVSLYSQESRPGFLDMYMRMHKLTQRKVAAELGKAPGTVSYWFRTDDIYVVNLREFADAFNAKLEVQVSQNKH